MSTFFAAPREADARYGDPVSDPFGTRKIADWLRPRTAIERAQESERHFVFRVALLIALFASIGAAGVIKVKRTTVGVRTAYDMVKTSDELRTQLDENRRLEAQLTGLKNPNALRREATDHFDMRAPASGDLLEVE